ncbi:MAG: hypothetical protein LUC31_03175 [Coprobacillus sp.]|nr:hypothetical protein [Coprobacillus sp.]
MLQQITLSCLLLIGNMAGLTASFFTNDDEMYREGCCLIDAPYASCLDNEREITGVDETYILTVSEEVNSLTYRGEVTLLEYTIKEGTEVTCLLTDFIDLGNIIFDFYHDEEYIASYALYFARDDEGAFYSSGRSLDCAKSLAGQELGYVFLASEEEPEEELESETSSGHRTHGKIYGYFKWMDDDEQIHPLVGAKVKLKVRGSFYSETTYTDDNGYYCFEYSNVFYYGSGMATVTLSLENDLIKVKNSNVYAYKYKLQKRDVTYELSQTFSPEQDGDFGKAASIFQGFYCFSKVAKEFDYKNKLSKISIIYPSSRVMLMSFMWGERKIEVANYIEKSGYPKAYASWDSFGHEYAHFVCARYGFFSWSSSNIAHNSIINRIELIILNDGDSARKAKRVSTRLAFNEAWAATWSVLIQQYFDDEWKSVATVGDSCYTNSSGVDDDFDDYDTDHPERYGDSEELALSKILYKLATFETDEYDKFSLGFEEFWRISYENKTKSLYDFIDAMYEQGYSKSDLGLLLGQFNVTPNKIQITNYYLDTCPTLTWSAYMGTAYFNYNRFDIYFLDDNGNEILKKKVKSHGEVTCSYTLKEEDWQLILDSCQECFSINMVVWQTTYRDTGGYYTETFSYDLPTQYYYQ